MQDPFITFAKKKDFFAHAQNIDLCHIEKQELLHETNFFTEKDTIGMTNSKGTYWV